MFSVTIVNEQTGNKLTHKQTLDFVQILQRYTKLQTRRNPMGWLTQHLRLQSSAINCLSWGWYAQFRLFNSGFSSCFCSYIIERLHWSMSVTGKKNTLRCNQDLFQTFSPTWFLYDRMKLDYCQSIVLLGLLYFIPFASLCLLYKISLCCNISVSSIQINWGRAQDVKTCGILTCTGHMSKELKKYVTRVN